MKDVLDRLREVTDCHLQCDPRLVVEAATEIAKLRDEQRVMLQEIHRVCQQDAVITDLRMVIEAQDQEINSLHNRLLKGEK